ncbi:FGGY-family carbohydrate kinase [Demequina sp.]|uniref:FGGY-family carbohydrate kinase n=1 Tax=Demequina sp. TaxID=2050685 RepID=UPI003A8486CB
MSSYGGLRLIGLDAGGTFIKATVFDLGTGATATRTKRTEVTHPSPGWAERDPDGLWQAATHVIQAALADLPPGGQIAALGVTAHGNGAYLVDQAGAAVRPAIQAADTRAAALVAGWRADGVVDRLRPRCWNGLWPGQPGPVVAWLAAHEPAALSDSNRVLLCGDYLRARLTGQLAGEITAWSCSGLVDNVTGDYSAQALVALGIDHLRHLLPELIDSLTVAGAVSADAAAVTGIPVGTPVIAGAVDNVAMQIGAGATDESNALVGAGTWSINQLLVPVSDMVMDGPLGEVAPYAACLAVPASRALLIEASATSASTLGWALHRVLRGVAADADRAGENVYSYALQVAGMRELDAESPYFLPFLDGSRDWASARGEWNGLSSSHDDYDLVLATVEGVCFEHKRHIERLARARTPIGTIRLAGGAGRSHVWSQMYADILGIPVEVSEVEEVGALGAAVIAGSAVGLFASVDAGVEALNPTFVRFAPRPAQHDLARLRYQEYLRRVGAAESATHAASPAVESVAS